MSRTIEQIGEELGAEYSNIQATLYSLAEETRNNKQPALAYALRSLYDRMNKALDNLHIIQRTAETKYNKP